MNLTEGIDTMTGSQVNSLELLNNATGGIITPNIIFDRITISDGASTTILFTGVGAFIFIAIGLYLINKKLKEPNPWISFIPVLQIWGFFQASRKSFVTRFILPMIGLIIGIVLSGMLLYLKYPVYTAIALLAITSIYSAYCWLDILHAISTRLGRGIGTTILLLLLNPFMLFYLGLTMKEEEVKKI